MQLLPGLVVSEIAQERCGVGRDAVADVLRGAWALVLNGWCRGEFSRDGHYSLTGAIQTAGDGGLSCLYARRVLQKLLVEIDLDRWNDHPLREKRDVLEALSGAIVAIGGRAPRRGGWAIGGAS